MCVCCLCFVSVLNFSALNVIKHSVVVGKLMEKSKDKPMSVASLYAASGVIRNFFRISLERLVEGRVMPWRLALKVLMICLPLL